MIRSQNNKLKNDFNKLVGFNTGGGEGIKKEAVHKV